MDYKWLSRIRYLVPGAMLYVLLVSFCSATKWCSFTLPNKLEDLLGLVFAAVLAFPYSASGLRNCANKRFFDQVNGNLVAKLTGPFQTDPMVPKGLTWQQVRPLFYNLVNSDNALKHQSQRAFRNGALWTSAADLRAVSLIGLIVFPFAIVLGQYISQLYFPPYRALIGIATCIITIILSYWFSRSFTARQIEIGNEQIEHILMHHRQKLRDGLIKIVV